MKKIIFILLILVIAAVGYYFYFIFNKESKLNNRPMTKEICEMYGGQWSEMEILKEEGDVYKNFCICPKKLFTENPSLWINEGTMEKCP
ncbi:MAG: hypothetical protein A3A94_03250 [Candidatus Portnoybacteria bacterium RIFCSPLOWO2_01_FULL_43_11]|uniref:Uncharacterized protein n=3 Tax=Bacteria candidate phyla TaxID=1783234 RepID=A0A1G2FHL1_9BACT|nr:MAG: hypothetical protein A2713_02315 [candidate division WWE3 bacterium RIFCSPHIGHO2_01_FULL_35_17]OGZ37553.1 MAG: hypothetical protein A3E90_00260 [Candidatus Portnoybacteria bacterium RIFCSPHIGHO2_12_FULL_40_11]OGZ38908.1 MAG: hypothetical protein A3A94_03250 [Candidatus Portnoybacteria bacterium RIFCSPLOWO2_01_FULL_43_11]